MNRPRASLVEVRPAGDRFLTATTGIESWHSFSFGAHYDPANMAFGGLLAHNDETLAPGAGFDPHPHRGVEIITYVVSGALSYSDDAGRTGVARPGFVQLASAGSGIVHTERNVSATDPARFIQLWVGPDVGGPDVGGIEPSYQLAPISNRPGELVPIAAGADAAADAPVGLHSRTGCVSLARLDPGQLVQLPVARFVHLFVVSGAIDADRAGALTAADALRLTDSAAGRVTATEAAQLLVWNS